MFAVIKIIFYVDVVIPKWEYPSARQNHPIQMRSCNGYMDFTTFKHISDISLSIELSIWLQQHDLCIILSWHQYFQSLCWISFAWRLTISHRLKWWNIQLFDMQNLDTLLLVASETSWLVVVYDVRLWLI